MLQFVSLLTNNNGEYIVVILWVLFSPFTVTQGHDSLKSHVTP